MPTVALAQQLRKLTWKSLCVICCFVFFLFPLWMLSLAVVGEKEKMTNSVNVRTRDNKVHGELTVPEVLARLSLLKQSRCRNAEEVF